MDTEIRVYPDSDEVIHGKEDDAGPKDLHTRVDGALVVSGLLASDRTEVERRLIGVGFSPEGARSMRDHGGETWLSLLMRRTV